ncbi:hypothetical protein LTR08_007709 [Meristemomyces frigidus]|nr:hypothetical protein LTR08_007709 [Meristemomyces frigidus]
MDYNYFTSSATQPYQYLDFGADAGLLPGVNDGSGVTTSLEHPLDPNASLYGPYDFTTFDTSIGHSNDLTSLPTTSASPPSHQLTRLSNGSVDSGIALDLDEPSGRRSSSEDKEGFTPAQSRRKAQNRAAQRAFRERKERHVRDLEAKLNLLATTTSSLQSDNERLKLMLQKVQTENEILKATNASSPTATHPPSFVDDPSLMAFSRHAMGPPTFDEPRFNTVRLANGLLSTGSSSPGKFSSPSDSESHLLSASATWDLLQAHPLYLSGAVDIGEVCERLKKMARCDGMGPMFREMQVRAVIEEVGRSGGDELI